MSKFPSALLNSASLVKASPFRIVVSLFVITATAAVPVAANEPAQKAPTVGKVAPAKAAPAKPASTKTDAAKAAPAKKEASFSDKPVGAKSQEELLKKFEAAYKNKDGVAYIALLQVPFRQRVRMELQFQRECKLPCNNFKLVSVEHEIYRVNMPSANIGKPRLVDGVKEDYDLPVVGFINYDVFPNVQAPPDVIGMAIGEDKASHLFYIVTRHAPLPAAAAKPH